MSLSAHARRPLALLRFVHCIHCLPLLIYLNQFSGQWILPAARATAQPIIKLVGLASKHEITVNSKLGSKKSVYCTNMPYSGQKYELAQVRMMALLLSKTFRKVLCGGPDSHIS
jgi:hypothetical protein